MLGTYAYIITYIIIVIPNKIISDTSGFQGKSRFSKWLNRVIKLCLNIVKEQTGLETNLEMRFIVIRIHIITVAYF